MSPQKLKRTLQKDLRTSRSKKSRSILVGGLLLIGFIAIGSYRLWIEYRPAALLRQGIRLEQQNIPKKALQRYTELVIDYPMSELTAEALYRSGRIQQFDLRDDQRALIAYLQLEKNYPKSQFLSQAQHAAAELTKYRLDDCGQAIPIYQRMIEQSHENGDANLYEIADCYVQQKNWAQAAIEFESLLTSYPQSELRAITQYRLANAWLLGKQRKKAREGFERVSKEFAERPIGQEASFRLAEMLEEKEHLKEALQAFSELTRYPRQDLLKQKIQRLKQRMARKKKVL